MVEKTGIMHVCTIAKKCTKHVTLIEFHQWWIQGRGLGCGSPHPLVLDQTDCPPLPRLSEGLGAPLFITDFDIKFW